MRKMFRANVIKFVIGIILLSISFIYLQSHPAERVSVLSWFEVMYQKINIFYHDMVDKWDSKLLKEKYSLQKYYKELVRMAENKSCIDSEIVEEVTNLSDDLNDDSLDEFTEKLRIYTRQVYKYDAIVKKECN